MIGIIIAMDKELAPLLSGRECGKTIRKNKEFYRFRIGGSECVAVKSGIGKVNAAYAATVLIEEFNPDFIISTGISGGLGKHGLLELVIAEKAVQYDVDTSALGDPAGFVSTVDKIYFETDRELTEIFAKASGAKKTVFACGDRFVADENTKKFIVDTFNAGACDMESGAIAQIAYIAGKKFVAIRCISDGAGSGAELDYEKTTDIASDILARAVEKGIKIAEKEYFGY